MAKEKKIGKEEECTSSSIHGDILEHIFTHVPLIHLVPAFHVSKSWKRAVLTSLRHFNKIKPWLLLHSQSTRPPYSTSLHVYDPRSHVWIQIQQPPISHISVLRSSHSKLLYVISPSKFSFSFDPMHLTWHHVDAPLLWRSDPIVAVVGHRIVLAGGTCDFQDDPLAVEMYDLNTRSWSTCDSMPAVFKDSAASMWLSIAVNGNRMYVMEKSTGVAYRFDPEAKSWHGPYNLSPDCNVCSFSIGFANDRLILTGLIGDYDEEGFTSLKLWEITGNELEACREIGVMPKEFLEKLRGEDFYMSSGAAVAVNVMGDLAYISNSCNPEFVFLCEIGDGECSWRSVKNAIVNDKSRLTERMVFTCANVSLRDLHMAMVDAEFAELGIPEQLS